MAEDPCQGDRMHELLGVGQCRIGPLCGLVWIAQPPQGPARHDETIRPGAGDDTACPRGVLLTTAEPQTLLDVCASTSHRAMKHERGRQCEMRFHRARDIVLLVGKAEELCAEVAGYQQIPPH